MEPGLLVLSATRKEGLDLCKHLIRRYPDADSCPSADEKFLSVSNPDEFPSSTLVIDTKYYKANVRIWLGTDISEATEQAIKHLAFYDIQAVVLVHTDEVQSQEQLQIVQKLASFSKVFKDAETKLVLASKIKNNWDSLREWSITEGFELVQTCSQESEDGNDRNLVGVNRIAEALQTTMWKNMKMKTLSLGASEDESSKCNEAPRKEEKLKQISKGNSDALFLSKEETLEGEILDSNDNTSLDDDFDMDSMFEAVERIRSMRSETATMSDEERRDKAAEMAMKLVGLLN